MVTGSVLPTLEIFSVAAWEGGLAAPTYAKTYRAKTVRVIILTVHNLHDVLVATLEAA